MDQGFQPDFEPKDTLGLLGVVLRCAILIPTLAFAIVYGVLTYRGTYLGRLEWKTIIFYIWAGTMVAMLITVLRSRRTKSGRVGELLPFSGWKRKKK